MALCFGATEACTKANGVEVFLMEKVLYLLTKEGMFKAKG